MQWLKAGSAQQHTGMLSALNPAAGHWCFVTAHLFAEWL